MYHSPFFDPRNRSCHPAGCSIEQESAPVTSTGPYLTRSVTPHSACFSCQGGNLSECALTNNVELSTWIQGRQLLVEVAAKLRAVFVFVAVLLASGFTDTVVRGDNVLSDGVLSATLSERGEIQEMTWNRPGMPPVTMVFRHDKYSGFSWHVCVADQWHAKLPLERVKSGTNEFALNLDGIVYSLAYTVQDGRLEVLAGIQNNSDQVFALSARWSTSVWTRRW